MTKLIRGLPYYQGLGATSNQNQSKVFFFAKGGDANLGLLFNKFADTWNINTNGKCELQKPSGVKNKDNSFTAGSKQAFIKEIITYNKDHSAQITENLNRHHRRMDQLHTRTGIKTASVQLSVDWRFITGLGIAHPFETGFAWHHTLGVPYLPGSSVKGLLRAWAKENETDEIARLFGDSKENGAGSMIVFDALPVKSPTLELDIMNPHYGPYYNCSDGIEPPADYHNPKPVFFLSVGAGSTFRFILASRRRMRNPSDEMGTNDITMGLKLLTEALAALGAGGKTAVGYGHFRHE